MKRKFSFCAILFGLLMGSLLLEASSGSASRPLPTEEPKVAVLDEELQQKEQFILSSYLYHFVDSSNSLSKEALKEVEFAPFPGSDYPFDWRYTHWFRLSVHNPSLYMLEYVFLPGYHNFSTLYLHQGGQVKQLEAGNYLPLSERDYKTIWGSTYNNGFLVHLMPQATTTFYLKAQNPYEISIFGKNNFVYAIFRTQELLQNNALNHHWVAGLVQGALWFVLIFHIVQFFINRDPIYLWFCAFLFTIVLYLLDKQFLTLELFTGENPKINFYIFWLGSGGSFICFLQFTRIIITHVTNMPFIDAALKVLMGLIAYIFLSWLGVHTINLAWGPFQSLNPWLAFFPDLYRYVALSVFAALIYINIRLWLKSRSKVARYYVAANTYIVFVMMMFFSYAFLISLGFDGLMAIYRYIPVNYLSEIGIMGQVLLFSITLGYLWQEKEQKLREEFTQQVAQVEMTALRSQMNPHFLFNCLNSINRYVVRNDPRKASDYLTKFARLIRLILQNSKSQMVPLADELEALRLYTEMESLRFDKRFEYSIEIGNQVEADYIEVPPMIFQPYVENAIWHGLLHKEEGDGQLKIRVFMDEDCLVCNVEDNGIGRERAAELKSKTATKKKSLGMQITSDRMKVMEIIHHFKTRIDIHDLVAPNGEPLGTRVEIRIPV